MRIGDVEYGEARQLAVILDCTPEEVVELSVRTMVQLVIDGDLDSAIIRSLKEMIQDTRARKAVIRQVLETRREIDQREDRARTRAAIKRKTEPKRRQKGLTHSPFADLLEDE